MKYEGLARAYRPRAFADVVGQEVTVRTLQQALRTGRAAPATLLAGSRGIGKTTLARLLAKAFVCEQGPTSTPCDACEPCQEIPQGRCLDVMEIDGASHTGVDDVRALRDSVRYGPAKCRCKVFIIDEVHMLSQSAFNALLKTLEEPPPHVRFIFATTEAHKIPATVLSRCQRYDLQRLDVGVIADRLTFVARQEKIDLSAEAVALIAEAADGSLRDALSLADQVVSFAPDSPTAQDVAAVLGIPDSQCVQQLAAAVLSGDAATALGICSRAAASGMDGQKLLRGFAWRMRHLAVAAAAGSDEQLIPLSEQQRQEV
ncbi:MAG: DNA polymerase III subunit gamma/tau, partial [Myxococcota bacterium]